MRARLLAALGVVGLAASCGLDAVGTLQGARPDASREGRDASGEDVAAPSDAEADAAPPDDAASDVVAADSGDADCDATASCAPDSPSILSPWSSTGSLAFQRKVDWTIGALDPAAVIRYTTDGTTPGPTSPSAPGVVTLPALADKTTIKWTSGPTQPVQTFAVNVQATLQGSAHVILERATIDPTTTPYATVAANKSITVHVAYQLWSQSSCPGCVDQITFGFTTAAGCLYDDLPGVYPGASGTTTFTIKSPTASGTYPIKTGFTEQLKCSDALGSALGGPVIAVLVVP